MKTPQFNSFIIVAIWLSILFNFAESFAQTSRKTIIYDWQTKNIVDDKALPFDEPFTIKIINLDTAIKELQLIIKEGECTSSKDIDCFNELTEVCKLTFSQSVLQNLTTKLLKPNTNYRIGLKVIKRSKITETDKDELFQYLSGESELSTEINNALSTIQLTKLNISDLNRILYRYVKNYNGEYELDTSAVETAKGNEAKFRIFTAYEGLKEAGSKIKDLTVTLKETFHFTETELAPISSLIYDTDYDTDYENCCLIKTNFSIITFLTKLESIKNQLKEKFPSAIDSIDREFGPIDTGFNAAFNGRNDEIRSWINLVLLRTTIEKTYLIITPGTTTIDQQSTTTTPYISQSFGYGFSPRTAKGLFFFSYSIFFRPINLSVPLKYYNKSVGDYIKTRFCLNLGFTLESVETNKSGKISGLGSLFGTKAGLAGLGWRPWSFLKLDMNMMMYYMNDPNPLLNQKRFTASPLIGISFNLNIIKIFTGQPNTLTKLDAYTKS